MQTGKTYRVVYAILGASALTRMEAIVRLRELSDKVVFVPD